MGSEEIVGNLERTVELPNATYKFDVISDSADVYELKSKARIDVDIDGRAINGRSGDGWFSSQARAFSSSQLVDTAIVEGLRAGEVGGVVEFLWNVTGASTINVDPKLRSDAYKINELFATAFFNTLEEAAVPELLVNNQSQPPVGTSSVQSVQPGFFEPVTVPVDWLVGEELAVFFELQTNARLGVDNLDAAGFEATIDSDFSNTATLTEIRIYDDQGNLLPDAYIRSSDGFIYDPADAGLGSDPLAASAAVENNGSGSGNIADDNNTIEPVMDMSTGGVSGAAPNAVPEPTTIAIWLVLAGLLGVREFRRKFA